MADVDPLAGLKPLIAPAPVAWWPPAPGWWLVGITLFVLLMGLLVWAWKRRRFMQRTRYRREALLLLAPLHDVQNIALLIRRAAISSHGREQAATANWQTLCPNLSETSLQILREAQYRAEAPSLSDIEKLRSETQAWISTLPPLDNARKAAR